MLKKTLLTTLLSLSTIATASINLDLNLTVKSQSAENSATENVVVDENVPAVVVFKDFASLSFAIVANSDNDTADIQVQIFQKIDNDELMAATETISVSVPLNQPATIIVNKETNNEEDNGSLILTITPSLVE